MARMKSPDRGGCNSAFWLMPEGRYTRDFFFMDTEFPDVGCSEIDIVEYSPFSERNFRLPSTFGIDMAAVTDQEVTGVK